MKTATTQVYRAFEWILKNPEAWEEVQRICLTLEAREENGRKKYATLTRDGVYMLAQLEGLEITDDRAFKRDHDLWSTLVRYLLEIHPQLDRVFETRKCAVDDYAQFVGLPQLPSEYIYGGDAA